MLLPGSVWMGLATCNGSLLVYTASSSYNVRSLRQSFSSNHSNRYEIHHDVHHPLLRRPCGVRVDHRQWRANSSLARAKAALRKGRIPYQSASSTEVSSRLTTGEKIHSKPVLPTLSTLAAEDLRLRNLKEEYYAAVNKHSDVLWFTYEECKQVPGSIVNGWIRRPKFSRNGRRYGISRQTANAANVSGYISNPVIRKRIINWEENTCSDLAPQFKDMVIARARLAKMAGFKSFFDYRSRYKMLNLRSVKLFLNDFRSQFQADSKTFVESIIEQKMRDLDFHDFSIQELRQKLTGGKSVRDFQLYHPEAQIDLGDVAYYTGRSNVAEEALKRPEDPAFSEYFSADHTIPTLLSLYGDILGMDFLQLSRKDQVYQVAVTLYLETQDLAARDGQALEVYQVSDTTGFPGEILGFLVLDLEDRDDKARVIFHRHIGSVRLKHSHSNKQIPCSTIVTTWRRSGPKGPILLTHTRIKQFAHELGHAIHSLVQGSNGFKGPRDFVEIPSTFAENWMHIPEVLQRISCHYTYLKPEFLIAWQDDWKTNHPSKNLPPQPSREAPLAMFEENVLRRHPKDEMYITLLLLWQSMVDVIFNGSTEEELGSMDLGVACNNILEEWTGLFTVSNGERPIQNNSYLHWVILADYDTSAYCYLLAKVYSYDLWSTHFAKNPFSKKAGRRWRKIVLEHHDTAPTQDAMTRITNSIKWKVFGVPRTHMEALTKFLGREPDSRAFFKALKAPINRNLTFWRRTGIRMGLYGRSGWFWGG